MPDELSIHEVAAALKDARGWIANVVRLDEGAETAELARLDAVIDRYDEQHPR